MKKFILLLVGFLISILAFASIASANGNVSITRAQPDPNSKNNTWFILEAQPGQKVENSVLIKNMSSQPIKVRILAIDSKSNKAGRFILKRSDEKQETIGKWTELETNTTELAPLQTLPVKFTINVPDNTEPGEYAGGIVVEEIAPPSQQSIVTTRIGNRIYLKVPGYVEHNLRWLAFNSSIAKINIGNPFYKIHYFQFTLENKGNTVVRPTVTIDIFNIFNNKVATIEKQLGEFQPGGLAEPLIKWENAPLFGMFTAKATINLSETNTGQQTIIKEISITIIPWELIIIIALLTVITVLSICYYKKKCVLSSLLTAKKVKKES